MTLDEFIAFERKRLSDFERYWRDEHVATPDEFPDEMQPGEWDEQYTAYTEV